MTPYIQKVPLAPCKAKIEIFSKSDAPVISTNGLHEVHERLAGDEAEYEADTDVEGIPQGPHLKGFIQATLLCSHSDATPALLYHKEPYT